VHLVRDGGEQHKPEFRALNPMRHVPVLELEESGETHHLAESMAILEFLEERHPAPSLLPMDAFLRARARQLALLVVSGIQPLQNTKVQKWVREQLSADGEAWANHWVTLGLEALEELAREEPGTYLVGDSVTLADVCLVPQMHFARRIAVDVERFPTLRRVEETCAKLPAFVAGHAENQIDVDT
jgi:maleylpyruvate isomerase